MRTIKFRAWNPELNKMSKPFSFGQILNFWDTNFKSLEPNKEIVMQFTGLHDKNGKEIYEGDIVTDGVGKYKIVYDLKLAGYQPYCIFRDEPENYCEVIGNVFENADLVKL